MGKRHYEQAAQAAGMREIKRKNPPGQIHKDVQVYAGSPATRPLPEVVGADVTFGNIRWLPTYKDVPDEFKHSHNPYTLFMSNWFFSGITQTDHNRIKPRPGVNANVAFGAIRACLCSWEPKHEHKIAGCAYLLSEWFVLDDTGVSK